MQKNTAPTSLRSESLRRMVTCAVLIALGTVLSIIQIPFPWLIWGGSVTLLSMLPICMVGLMYGPVWGIGSAFVFSVIQLMLSRVGAWGLSPTVFAVCVIFDYIVAFTVLGVVGFFKGRSNTVILIGVGISVFLRFICHFITGITIWEASMPDSFSNIWIYSLLYNGSYMLPELIFTVIGAAALIRVGYIKRLISAK